jgi:hypothetical protein
LLLAGVDPVGKFAIGINGTSGIGGKFATDVIKYAKFASLPPA